MKLMKKIGLVAAFSCTIFLGTFSLKTEAASLYVESTEIPKEATELASQSWEEYLSNIIYSEDKNISDYYLGTPFTISYPQNIKYNYPIINNKEKRIEYTLQMDQSDYQNRETYILSKALAAKLEELSTGIVTNNDQAIFLEGENQNIFYTYQNTINSLLINGEKDTIDKKILPSTISVYDITEKTALPKTRKARLSTEIDSNILPWTVYETQTDKPWCQYYTYAAVINNQAGKEITSAKKIIDGTYPQATDEQKEDTSWIISNSVNESINYVNKTFDKDLKKTPGLLSFDKVKAEIDNHRPVITNLKSDTTEAHSIVQMGYTAVKGNPSLKPFYHYWNPWWEDTFVVSSNSPYIFLGEDKFEWDYTMYNFQEMKPTVSYSSFVQDKRWLPTVENGQLSGTTGLGLRVEAIKINVSELASGISGGIAYSTHVQDIGWQPEVSNGQMAGTNGKKLRVEAIKIKLTGDLSKKYSVQYRTHVQDIGWTAYSKDNQMSGTSGKKLRIEALQIKLVKK